MFHHSSLHKTTVLIILGGLLLYATFGGHFARELVIQIAILAIAAISLDVAAGFGGMVSLCHGALVGTAAYLYTIGTIKLGTPPVIAALLAIILTALLGFIIGRIAGHMKGIFFIMVTLAVGQMLYSIFFKSRWLGGDDGISGIPRFAWLDTNNDLLFVGAALCLVGVTYYLAVWLLKTNFGHILEAIRINQVRTQALGIDTTTHRAQAFGFSALLTATAGILAAQHTQFISPDLLFWTLSGEILIVVILGGIGTLVGPLLGAVVLICIKHQVEQITDHWHIVIGVLLIATVMLGNKGIFGYVDDWRTRHDTSKKTM